MRIRREDLSVVVDVPGATARQIAGFGDASGYGAFAAEWFSLGAGTNLAPCTTPSSTT